MSAFLPAFLQVGRSPFWGEGVELGQVRPMPMPMPIPLPDPGAATPGDARPALPLLPIVTGGEGDDRLDLPAGGFAFGRGGDDVFVLNSAGVSGAPERLGFIGDFDEGDQLDLSRLGPSARILDREAATSPWGSDRISIDYDADGDEDGYLLVSDGKRPDIADFQPMPLPAPAPGNEVRILPYDGAAISNLDASASVSVAAPVLADAWLG